MPREYVPLEIPVPRNGIRLDEDFIGLRECTDMVNYLIRNGRAKKRPPYNALGTSGLSLELNDSVFEGVEFGSADGNIHLLLFSNGVVYKASNGSTTFSDSIKGSFSTGNLGNGDYILAVPHNTSSTVRLYFQHVEAGVTRNLPFYWDGAASAVTQLSITDLTNLTFQVVSSFRGHLVGADVDEGSSVIFPFRLRYSKINDATLWDDAVVASAGFVDLIDDGQPTRIMRLLPLRQSLIAYKENSTYVIDYSATTFFQPNLTLKEHGCISYKGAAHIPKLNAHLVAGQDNLYLFDGFKPTEIGDRIVKKMYDTFLADFDTNKGSVRIDVANQLNQAYITLSDGVTSHKNRTLVWNYKDNTFGTLEFSNDVWFINQINNYFTGGKKYLLGIDQFPDVCELEASGNVDLGRHKVESLIETRAYSAEELDDKLGQFGKMPELMEAEFSGAGSSLVVRAGAVDDVTDTPDYGSWKTINKSTEKGINKVSIPQDVRATQDNWYNTNWSYRTSFNINGAGAAAFKETNITGFKFYFESTGALANNLKDNALNTGNDILFTEEDGITKIPHEIISFESSTGLLKAYIKLDFNRNGDNKYFIYYGNSAATDQQDKTNLWSDHHAAYLFRETPTGIANDVIDSSGQNNANSEGMMNASDIVAGKLHKAIDLDGTDDAVIIPGLNLSTIGDFSISFWINTDVLPTSGNEVVVLAQNHATADENKVVYIDNPSGTVTIRSGLSSLNTTLFANTTWTKVVVSYKNGYATGAVVQNNVEFLGAFTVVNDASDFFLGKNQAGSIFLNAQIAELRIMKYTMTPNEAELEFSNQNTPSSFYTINSQEEKDEYPRLKKQGRYMKFKIINKKNETPHELARLRALFDIGENR